MPRRQRLVLLSLLLLSGCRVGPVQRETDRVLLELASRPFDVAPLLPREVERRSADRASEGRAREEKGSEKKEKQVSALPALESALAGESSADIRTIRFLQADSASGKQGGSPPKYELKVPPELPGAEASSLPDFSKMDAAQKRQVIQQIYADMPSLPEEPTPQPGPDGGGYTLADFQKLAVENSPTLRQAVSDVKNAEGALVQARTYQNPTIAYQAVPTNNNSNAGAQGGYIDQPIRMFGKMKMGVAMAQKDLDNAQLALRRARYDLSTNVRNAYFALLVAKETMRVNRALARFTDEIYRLYTTYSAAGFAAPYEPAPLRAAAYTNHLTYLQSIRAYIAAWQQLVATLGLPQLPLTEVQGSVDRLIPYYDYDKVRAYVLSNHTDVLTARNSVQRAEYNLKLAQITPYPDVDILGAVWKESTIAPYTIFYQAQVIVPIPIWDRNRGNIISAQAALTRALEETHRVDNNLTNLLAMNYANYQNNLSALEYYRRWILPDQVRYYRGAFNRRLAEPGAFAPGSLPPTPADLVTAQSGLAAAVQAYLGILSSLWTSVVSVADLIQTPDLFQQDLATMKELPELPNLDQMPNWLCPHHRMGGIASSGQPLGCAPRTSVKPVPVPAEGTVPMLPPADNSVLPPPRKSDGAPVQPPTTGQSSTQAKPADPTQLLLEPPPEIPKRIKDEGTP